MSPPAGFPHSVILGSRLVCSSPRLIAAYHDLHRLSMPRHPPCALLRLISVSIDKSLRQITRCDPPHGVDSSHPDLPVAREINHPSVDCQRARRIPLRLRLSAGSGPAKYEVNVS